MTTQKHNSLPPAEKIEIIEAVLDLFGQASEMLRGLGDEYIERTVVAELEGREGGWCAHTSADILRDALRAIEDDEEEVIE